MVHIVTKQMYDRYSTNGKLQLTSGALLKFFSQNDSRERNKTMITQLQNFRFNRENCQNPLESCARAKLSDGVYSYKCRKFQFMLKFLRRINRSNVVDIIFSFIDSFIDFYFAKTIEQQVQQDQLVGKGENGGEIIAIKELRIDMNGCIANGSAIVYIDSYELLSRNHLISPAHELLGLPQDAEEILEYNRSNFPIISFDWNEYNLPSNENMVQPSNVATPVRLIQPQSLSKWKIHGVCSSKGKVRPIKKKGSGKMMTVLNFHITDTNGDSIKVVGFDQLAERSNSMIELNKVYFISGCEIQPANRKYNTTDHEFELILVNESQIEPSRDVIPLPPFSLNICPLNELSKYVNRTVDILAVIDMMEPVNEYEKETGEQKIRRTIRLIDQSQEIINLKLWDEQVKNFEGTQEQVIGIKGASVSEYRGRLELTLLEGSWTLVNPSLREVIFLKDWYDKSQKCFSHNLRLLATAQSMNLRDESIENEMYIKGMVTAFKEYTVVYESCSKNGCRKRVNCSNSRYECERGHSSNTFKWRYSLQVEISDLSGSIWVTLFDDIARLLIKREPSELAELREQDENVCTNALEEIRFKPLIWRLSVNEETYKEKIRRCYTVQDIMEVDYDRYIPALLYTKAQLQQVNAKQE